MGSINKGVKIQRGFIAGVVAVCLVSVSTGLVIKYGGISASSIGSATANIQNYCQTRGVGQTEVASAQPTANETSEFGIRAKAYNIKINEKKASFRFVISAKGISKDGDGGNAGIDIGLTFKEGLDKTTWGGNNDRIYLLFQDGSRLDYVYNKAPQNQLMKKTFTKSFTNYSNISFNVEFQGKNYDGCIQSLSLPILLLASSDAENDVSGLIALSLKPGFSGYVLPAATEIVSTKELEEAGLSIWTFNRHGDEKWYTSGPSTSNFLHRTGYYIYNPTTETKKIKVEVSSGQQEPESSFYLVEGWNLMANSESTAKPLKDLKFYLNPCPPASDGQASCTTVGTTVQLSDLFIGDKMTQKAYPVIFVIKDLHSTDKDVAFKEILITESNRETAEIPAGTPFWIYIWP